MPSFLGVRCCECKRFQVQQQTKAAKFTCPVCGQKQSVLKVYCTASRAAEVRQQVSAWNMQAAQNEQLVVSDDDDDVLCPERSEVVAADTSAWEAFLPASEDAPTCPPPHEEPGYTTAVSAPQRRRKREGEDQTIGARGRADSAKRRPATSSRASLLPLQPQQRVGAATNVRPTGGHASTFAVAPAACEARPSHHGLSSARAAAPQHVAAQPQTLDSQRWAAGHGAEEPASTQGLFLHGASAPGAHRSASSHGAGAHAVWGGHVDGAERLSRDGAVGAWGALGEVACAWSVPTARPTASAVPAVPSTWGAPSGAASARTVQAAVPSAQVAPAVAAGAWGAFLRADDLQAVAEGEPDAGFVTAL